MSDIKAVTYEGAVTPTLSDTVNDPAGPFAGIYTGAGGTIKVQTRLGPVTFSSAAAGIVIPILVSRFWTGAPAGVLGMKAFPYEGPQS